ncbi:MAG: 16S rRNA (guanine(527)-N(7))-methyltransferase RsmG [Wenzhouxiangellaceae bacterium]|nr:16S rRNA (guanine(527)-N(7))-methyltransferase RsmG [Wenzhouxiangellaceae bacterium]
MPHAETSNTHPALREQLQRGVQALGQELPEGSSDRLLAYLDELQRWNRAYNLTAVRELAAMVERHLVDSLSVRPYLDGARIVDAGTGAGLPGVVLAIAEPERQFMLVDSNGKKLRFLRHVQRELALDNIEPRQARLEALTHEPAPDQVVTRALAPLARMVGWCAPWLARGTTLLAMKGELDPAECRAVPDQYNVTIHPLQWPGQTAARCVAVIRKGDCS